MARLRKGKEPRIKLKQPDRSVPDPSRETLLDLAEKRGLLKTTLGGDAPGGEDEDEDGDDLPTGRLADAVLWTISLTMLHFTLDVLVTHQYAVSLSWPLVSTRAAQAFPLILLLIYFFHSHPEPPRFIKPLPHRVQRPLQQTLFFLCSVAAGCYLIYISNTSGYYAIMKQAPPLGCLWIWAVIELNLTPACLSLICCVVYLKYWGYAYL